ncbi:peptidyl serine alpha-galactosyltransferase [Lolium perenne]|uniref:peptidyl serine alpha-galactosyltransferase n=1 Tax=Lolium perenne TaxID=4522 RepID=UPI0021EAB004|nr:peptidyl serine alpha-galactosyltransferase [Lolium perenne]
MAGAIAGAVAATLLLLLLALASAGAAAGDGRRLHTLFSVECGDYFDWQAVGLLHSLRKAGQPGGVTRLLSCAADQLSSYRGLGIGHTLQVPSYSRHPRTGDWYPAINKPVGVVHWLEHSPEADNVDWVVILDADQIVRGPIIPWELGAEKGKPVAAYYGYLKGCDNILAQLHTAHPEFCDKVGGILVMHIDDLRALAPLWLSKTEEVRQDKSHWSTNITGDIYGMGWISEMYGYSFGAAEVGLRHKINDDIMIYPGYTPRIGIEPLILHYGLPFKVGNWSFSKLEHHEDGIVYDCNRLFPPPPFPREVEAMEPDQNVKRGLYLSIECMNTLNEGLLLHHTSVGCPKPQWSKYLSFLKSKRFSELTKPKYWSSPKVENKVTVQHVASPKSRHPKIHTLFSTECSSYFDWQTVGLMHSFRLSGQPGNITRLLSCTDEEVKNYKGHDLAPTHYVPSMNRNPLTGDWYPAINKPAAVLHWINHVQTDAEFIVILDADMIMRGPITPWEYGAKRGHPVSTPYDYLIGCDNILAKIHTRNPSACDKVGGVIIMHIDDLRRFAMLWLHKSEEVRADKEHYATNITGDVYASGWISEMYGYSFAAAELNLRHIIKSDILIYPGYVPLPGAKYKVFHYGLRFGVGDWSFDKADWRNTDMVNKCWAKFPEPPDPSSVTKDDKNARERDLLSIECGRALNKALYLHHKRRNCPRLSTTTGNISKKIEEVSTTNKLERVTQRSSTTTVGRNSETMDVTAQQAIESATGSRAHRPRRLARSSKIWIIAIWAISVLVFLLVISMFFSDRRRSVSRSRASRSQKAHI